MEFTLKMLRPFNDISPRTRMDLVASKDVRVQIPYDIHQRIHHVHLVRLDRNFNIGKPPEHIFCKTITSRQNARPRLSAASGLNTPEDTRYRIDCGIRHKAFGRVHCDNKVSPEIGESVGLSNGYHGFRDSSYTFQRLSAEDLTWSISL